VSRRPAVRWRAAQAWCRLRTSAPQPAPRLRYWLFRVLGRAPSGRSTEGDPDGIETLRRGLSYSTTSETLREYFAQCGHGGIGGGDRPSAVVFGFVEMATAEEAQRAISELNGKDLDGRKLTVNLSTPKAPAPGRSARRRRPRRRWWSRGRSGRRLRWGRSRSLRRPALQEALQVVERPEH